MSGIPDYPLVAFDKKICSNIFLAVQLHNKKNFALFIKIFILSYINFIDHLNFILFGF